MNNVVPGLFGLNKTNRDFSQNETWGKNQFNSSFPAALCCYLHSKNIDANYLCIKNGEFKADLIGIEKAFGANPLDSQTYFAFEAQHSPYQKYVIGNLPRTDLVIQKEGSGECLVGLEVKLTALPDNTTCGLSDNLFGCEIVVRPDSIVYLACSIAASLGSELGDLLPEIDISDWTEPRQALEKIDVIVSSIENIAIALEKNQSAFLIQPVWKTLGKSPELSENCLDIFIWSDAGFSHFLSQIANRSSDSKSITRQTRTAIWLFKMLLDVKHKGKFNHHNIIDSLSYNTKNDKAFATAGNITNRYMRTERLSKPIITKSEIKNIILGGGQNMLSPERRFDAILFNSPGLFE